MPTPVLQLRIHFLAISETLISLCQVVNAVLKPSSSLVIASTLSASEMFDKKALRKFTVKAKFHYAILVADRSEAGRRPVTDLLARC